MRRLGNLSLWAINLGAATVIRPPDFAATGDTALISLFGGVLILDALSYALHRAQHAVGALWLFHKLHHSDSQVDITTAGRNHPLEGIITMPVIWLTIGMFHITLDAVNAYGAITLGTMLATHTRCAWPRWLERVLAPVIITREMHLRHHSVLPAEADTNFGGTFNFWDRLCGTFAPGRVPERFGI